MAESGTSRSTGGRRRRWLGHSLVVVVVAAIGGAAIAWLPELSERYGYVQSAPEEEIGGRFGKLTLISEESRASWLPIDAERWRVENARGEVLIEESGEDLDEWSFLASGARGRVSMTIGNRLTGEGELSIQVRGKRALFTLDDDGVFVLAPLDDAPADEDEIEIPRFEGLELFPERGPRKNPYLDD